jgi:rare lipoprotein A
LLLIIKVIVNGSLQLFLSRILAGWILLSALAGAQEPVTSAPTQGTASYYRSDFQGTTASGESYHPELYTAAHATLPLGSWVKVTNLRTGQSVFVRVNDRSPFVAGNLIDVSRAAAEKLDLLREGYAQVTISLLPTPPAGVAGAGAAKVPTGTNPAAPAAKTQDSLTPVSGALPPPVRPSKSASEPIRPVLRVQFGAFHELNPASQAQKELRDLGVDTVIYLRESPSPGEPIYRLVTSGGFAEAAGAQRWLEYIQKKSGQYKEAYVTN